MKKKILVGVLGAAMLTSAFAGEMNRGGQYYGTLNMGGYLNHVNTKRNVFAGLTFGYRFNNPFAVQVNAIGLPAGKYAGMLEGVYNISTNSSITPYIALGAGYSKLNNKARKTLDAGLGVRYDMTSHIALSLDYRYIENFDKLKDVTDPLAAGSTVGVGFTLFFGGATTLDSSTDNGSVYSTIDSGDNAPLTSGDKVVVSGKAPTVTVTDHYGYTHNTLVPVKPVTVDAGTNGSITAPQITGDTSVSVSAPEVNGALTSSTAEPKIIYKTIPGPIVKKDILQCTDNTATNSTTQQAPCYTIDSITLHMDAKFNYNDAGLNDGAKAAVNELAAFMKKYDVNTVALNGYASRPFVPADQDGVALTNDEINTLQSQLEVEYKAHNMVLSSRRAETVKSYLAELGLSPAGITATGKGWADPLLPLEKDFTAQELVSARNSNQRVDATVPVILSTVHSNS